ncbi:MAG: creatininase family protein [Bacteroidetes bacterium]|nr:creatininase family protein [Bacteroidota bacterium]
MIDSKRFFNNLTSIEVQNFLTTDSILCIPVGATEQHGKHLPLNTDTVLANGFARKMVSKYYKKYDLWLLPPLEISLSSEHIWASGTISFSTELFVKLFHELIKGLIDSQPARNIIIVNGHGGNRGILDTLIEEFRFRYSVATIVMHPSALSRIKSGSKFSEVHGGKSETSIMLALAPELVNTELIPPPLEENDQTRVSELILDKAVSWPWHSNDSGLGHDGIIGDAAFASAELGNKIIDSAVINAEVVITSLIAFGRLIRKND